MQMNELLKGYVFELEGFLSATTCDRWIADIEAAGFEPALINGVNGTAHRPDIRNNDRLIRDDTRTAQDLWRAAQPYVPSRFRNRDAIGLNERLRFYRYDVGQKFDWHQDGYFERPNGERSLFTFMVYLNEECKGGGTSFCDIYSGRSFPDFCVTPRKGTALLFFHPIMHRGDPVVSGRKYVMRTDVMYSPESA